MICGNCRTTSRSRRSTAPLVVLKVTFNCSLAWRALTISAPRSSRCAATESVSASMFASESEMRRTFSSLSSTSMRATRRFAVSAMFCSADGSVAMVGSTSLSLDTSCGALGLPPLSWMKVGPVRPSCEIFACVSVLIGVSVLMRTVATTLRGSFGARRSWSIVPTVMPL